MKLLSVRGSIFMACVLMLSPFAAQGKDGIPAGAGPATPNPGHTASSAPSAAGGGGGAVASTGATTSSVGHTANSGTVVYSPDLRGTSFQTFDSYYTWNNYYSYLSTHFDVSPVYFGRFYRNSEPLITPVMLKLTLREPIRLSSEMLDSIDQLQEIFESDRSDRQALVEKSKRIRELAKQIRRNQTLSNFDLRENKKLYSQREHAALSPEAMQELRRMATDLDRQLRDMYRQSSTSTVSVDSYKEPSLESLTKGIEKICKGIETQSKKL
jgi:hypothetical protein